MPHRTPDASSLPGLVAGPPAGVRETAGAAEGTVATAKVAKDEGQFRDDEMLAGRFRVIRYIAAGGMGEVYEVEDRQLQGVRLALKTILPHIASQPDMQQRFEREVLLARRVVHPNLCPIYDMFHCRHGDGDVTFLTMKLLSGETLSARLLRKGPMPLAEAQPLVLQVGSALAAAHEAGILHRDVKTANIMLQGTGAQTMAIVTDFGLARVDVTDTTALTTDGVPGTVGYLAPELLQGAPASKASDVYAFGVVVYKTLVGTVPPPALNLKAQLARDPVVRKLPVEWKRLLCGCLEPVLEKRYQSLPEALAGLGGGRGMSRRQMIALGATAAAAAAGGVWFGSPSIESALHPLPPKRFVALLGWPVTEDAKSAPIVTSIVDAVGTELTRAEQFDRNLYVIPHYLGKEVATLAQLNDVRESLGANLILAVAAVAGPTTLDVSLHVLGSVLSSPLRTRTFRVAWEDQLSVPARAVKAAAELLDVRQYGSDQEQDKLGTAIPQAFTAFQEAEDLRKKENDIGLGDSIEKYKQAIELDPRYGVAQERLAWAYLRTYGLHADPAALSLAKRNAETAIRLDPDLSEAHLALASYYELSGDFDSAGREMSKSLSLDPSNLHALIYQANFYAAANKWQEAEAVFSRIFKLRPNHWLAHQELANVLDMQGKYREALTEFKVASFAAPKNALAMKNIGTVYLQLGRVDEAMERLNASWALSQDGDTASTLAEAFRVQEKYKNAMDFASESIRLNPTDPYNWQEMGDIEAGAKRPAEEVRSRYRRAETLRADLLEMSPKDGPSWMRMALHKAKLGLVDAALVLIARAEAFHADDMDSQLVKVRVLEICGRRDEALSTAGRCLTRGPTQFQLQMMPDLEELQASKAFREMIGSVS